MHRFVRDLRYRRRGAVTRDFPIAAIYRDTPLEPIRVLAVPGAYAVALTVDDATMTQPLTLGTDPHATITPFGLAQQFTLATTIARLMTDTSAAFERTKSANQPSGSQSGSPQSAAPFAALEALNGDLATAYDVVEGSDRAPTAQAIRAIAALEQRARHLLSSTLR
jgi:hypothetical protein